jgi:PAS domain S-box-containing protein
MEHVKSDLRKPVRGGVETSAPGESCGPEAASASRTGGRTRLPRGQAVSSLSRRLGRDASSLLPDLAIIEPLFDHLPDTAFFLKDCQGRYLVVNQSLVERCGLRHKTQLVGRHVRDVFPKELAEVYAAQDQTVLRTCRPLIDHLELHWYASRRPGWCLTTKLPIRDQQGQVVGVIGISRDLRAPGESNTIPASIASTLEYLEGHFDEPLSPSALAKRAALPSFRFARLVKRIFRLSPKKLILQTRLNAAARLLTETDSGVAEIAYSCGFYDQSALTRAFRSATSLTPTQFRAMKGRAEANPKPEIRNRKPVPES